MGIFRFFEIDGALVFTLLGRFSGSLFGLITLWFVYNFISPLETGFYFTFASILALQIIFELGMFQVIMQFASHEMPLLSYDKNGFLRGSKSSLSRLASILRFIFYWYGVISLLMLVIIMPVGYFVISSGHSSDLVEWQMPWILLVISASINIFVMPLYSFLDGCGQIKNVAKIRIVQNTVGSCFAWISLIFGAGLYSLAMMNGVVTMVAISWLFFFKKSFIVNILRSYSLTYNVNWKKEILPYQWRVALSYFSGYFSNQALIPLAFILIGPIESGQMGFSFALTWALLSISLSWVNTKTPTLGLLFSSNKKNEAYRLFIPALRNSTIIVVLGSAIIIGLKFYLDYIESPLSLRMIEIWPLLILLLTTVLNNIIFSISIYLRADKTDPTMPMMIVLSSLTLVFSYVLAEKFGVMGIISAYLAVTFFVGFIWSTSIFMKRRLLLMPF